MRFILKICFNLHFPILHIIYLLSSKLLWFFSSTKLLLFYSTPLTCAPLSLFHMYKQLIPLFTDSECANLPVYWNVFVLLESVLAEHLQSFVVETLDSPRMYIVAGIKQGYILASLFSSHTVNRCLLPSLVWSLVWVGS